jgi:hypothetical protein
MCTQLIEHVYTVNGTCAYMKKHPLETQNYAGTNNLFNREMKLTQRSEPWGYRYYFIVNAQD